MGRRQVDDRHLLGDDEVGGHLLARGDREGLHEDVEQAVGTTARRPVLAAVEDHHRRRTALDRLAPA